MTTFRFDSEPRDRRIYVLPEPVPGAARRVTPVPVPLEQHAAHVDVLLRGYLEPRAEWVSFETLARALAVSPKRIQRALSRAWQAGLIERDLPPRKHRFDAPVPSRAYRWQKAAPSRVEQGQTRSEWEAGE